MSGGDRPEDEDLAASSRASLGTPRGARDLLPDACAMRRRLVDRLLAQFSAWGYRAVATPALEYFDVLARGMSEADRRRCIRFVAGEGGELLTLRADATPQIARMIGQRLGGELSADGVHRLCYATEVVRQPATPREPAEVHQVGVELVGDPHAAADAEIVALSRTSVAEAGLQALRLDIAHARLVEHALDRAGVAEAARAGVRARLAAKDRDGTAARLHEIGVDGGVRDAIAALCDLFGGVAVLDRAEQPLAPLGDRVGACLRELRALVEQLAALDSGAAIAQATTIDLGEVRGFDYYSGVRLRGWAAGVERPIIRGGRYDELMPKYGAHVAATGFAIDLDALEAALAVEGRSLHASADVAAHVVAVPAAASAKVRADAAAHAARLRASGVRAWVEVGLDLAQAQAVARAAGATALSLFSADGSLSRFRDAAGSSWTAVADGETTMKGRSR
jgi:ATP phosphoribosyltransferase regulatory subunit